MLTAFIFFLCILLILFILMACFATSSIVDVIAHYWSIYSQNNTPIIGIFTCLGAIFTVCVFYTTYRATKNAEENTKISEENVKLARDSINIAEENLILSRKNAEKDDFIKQFTLLIEQHNKSHEIIMGNLESYIIDKDDNIKWHMTIQEASKTLYLNYKFSTYMRILFRVLKHCDENFYESGDTDEITKEKKKYTSIVRSMIRNDVLYFVAINSMNNHPAFNNYREKLEKFTFFEHLTANKISDNFSFSVDLFYKKERKNEIYLFIHSAIIFELKKIFNSRVKHMDFFITHSLKECDDIRHSFNYDLTSKYIPHEYDKFKSKIESLINFRKCFDNAFYDIKNELGFFDCVNFSYYLYISKKETRNSSNYEKIKHPPYNLDYLSRMIIEYKMSIDKFESFMNAKFKVEELYFSEYDENQIDNKGHHIMTTRKIYCRCEDYTRRKTRDYINKEKDNIFNKIISIVTGKMNKTSLITKSGEKFIVNTDNNIVFENSKINVE